MCHRSVADNLNLVTLSTSFLSGPSILPGEFTPLSFCGSPLNQIESPATKSEEIRNFRKGFPVHYSHQII